RARSARQAQPAVGDSDELIIPRPARQGAARNVQLLCCLVVRETKLGGAGFVEILVVKQRVREPNEDSAALRMGFFQLAEDPLGLLVVLVLEGGHVRLHHRARRIVREASGAGGGWLWFHDLFRPIRLTTRDRNPQGDDPDEDADGRRVLHGSPEKYKSTSRGLAEAPTSWPNS